MYPFGVFDMPVFDLIIKNASQQRSHDIQVLSGFKFFSDFKPPPGPVNGTQSPIDQVGDQGGGGFVEILKTSAVYHDGEGCRVGLNGLVCPAMVLQEIPFFLSGGGLYFPKGPLDEFLCARIH